MKKLTKRDRETVSYKGITKLDNKSRQGTYHTIRIQGKLHYYKTTKISKSKLITFAREVQKYQLKGVEKRKAYNWYIRHSKPRTTFEKYKETKKRKIVEGETQQKTRSKLPKQKITPKKKPSKTKKQRDLKLEGVSDTILPITEFVYNYLSILKKIASKHNLNLHTEKQIREVFTKQPSVFSYKIYFYGREIRFGQYKNYQKLATSFLHGRSPFMFLAEYGQKLKKIEITKPEGYMGDLIREYPNHQALAVEGRIEKVEIQIGVRA